MVPMEATQVDSFKPETNDNGGVMEEAFNGGATNANGGILTSSRSWDNSGVMDVSFDGTVTKEVEGTVKDMEVKEAKEVIVTTTMMPVQDDKKNEVNEVETSDIDQSKKDHRIKGEPEVVVQLDGDQQDHWWVRRCEYHQSKGYVRVSLPACYTEVEPWSEAEGHQSHRVTEREKDILRDVMTRRDRLEVNRAKKSVLKPSEAHKLTGEELMMLMNDGEVKDQGDVDHKNVNDQIRASALMNRARETHRVKMDSLQRLHPSEAHIITKDEKKMMGEDLIQEDSESKEGIDKGSDDNIRGDHNSIADKIAKALGVNLDELFWIFGVVVVGVVVVVLLLIRCGGCRCGRTHSLRYRVEQLERRHLTRTSRYGRLPDEEDNFGQIYKGVRDEGERVAGGAEGGVEEGDGGDAGQGVFERDVEGGAKKKSPEKIQLKERKK